MIQEYNRPIRKHKQSLNIVKPTSWLRNNMRIVIGSKRNKAIKPLVEYTDAEKIEYFNTTYRNAENEFGSKMEDGK